VDLVEFLTKRIEEDEQDANIALPCGCGLPGFPLEHGYRCPVRVLAECQAKRRIIERAREKSYMADTTPGPTRYITSEGLPWLLELLAEPYHSHPDFQEEWRG
jgi:hypothetical protein